MITLQWIQLVSSIILALATCALALITYGYMMATKNMANFMEIQSKIMTREFERRVAPVVNITFQKSQTGYEEGKYHYAVSNLGTEPITLKEIRTKLWHPDEPKRELSPVVTPVNRLIAPSAGSIEVDIPIKFSEINATYSDVQSKKKILMKPVFIIEDVNHKEFEIEGYDRSIWQ